MSRPRPLLVPYSRVSGSSGRPSAVIGHHGRLLVDDTSTNPMACLNDDDTSTMTADEVVAITKLI